jgi:hypothetical protein
MRSFIKIIIWTIDYKLVKGANKLQWTIGVILDKNCMSFIQNYFFQINKILSKIFCKLLWKMFKIFLIHDFLKSFFNKYDFLKMCKFLVDFVIHFFKWQNFES